MYCLHQALSHFYICWGKAQNSEKVHIRLICHAFLCCLMTRKGLLQQQEKQDNLRWLYWALCKGLVFPQSSVEIRLPLPKMIFIYSFRFMQNDIKAAPSLHWSSSVSYLLLLEKYKCWSANKSQKSLSGIWKAAAVWGVASSILPSTFLRLKIPLKEVICY